MRDSVAETLRNASQAVKRIIPVAIWVAVGLTLPRPAHAENVYLDYVKQVGGEDSDRGNAIAVDASGNIYVRGLFSGTVDFDPGPGTAVETGGGLNSGFVVKLDPEGDFIWVKIFDTLGNTGRVSGWAMATDGSGNVYVSGWFWGTVDFDPGPATLNITSQSPPFGFYDGTDIFVCKLDSAGNLVWVKTMGDMGTNRTFAIALDGTNNLYLTGSFMSTMDFNPGLGVSNLTSAGQADIFVSKWDSDGNFIWAKRMGGPELDDGESIAVDGSGNVYSTGHFRTTVDFNPGPGTANIASLGEFDAYISKLNSDGNFIWAKAIRGSGSEFGHQIVIDQSGTLNLLVTFLGPDSVDADPGPGVVTMNDMFVSKFDSGGNLIWARAIGRGSPLAPPTFTSSNDAPQRLAIDGSGNLYITGSFHGIVDFDPGPGNAILTSRPTTENGTRPSSDVFVSKLSVSGDFVWATAVGGSGSEVGVGIDLDGMGNVYAVGGFERTADFDPFPLLEFNLTSNGEDDVFILKLRNTFGLAAASNRSLSLACFVLCIAGFAMLHRRARHRLHKRQ